MTRKIITALLAFCSIGLFAFGQTVETAPPSQIVDQEFADLGQAAYALNQRADSWNERCGHSEKISAPCVEVKTLLVEQFKTWIERAKEYQPISEEKTCRMEVRAAIIKVTTMSFQYNIDCVTGRYNEQCADRAVLVDVVTDRIKMMMTDCEKEKL
jgi:hypothetical protein